MTNNVKHSKLASNIGSVQTMSRWIQTRFARLKGDDITTGPYQMWRISKWNHLFKF